MKRQIFLDTETTGLDPKQGHRIIEIAGLEMINRRLTGRALHHYLNPERNIDDGAKNIHGIERAFLEDKPKFAEIAEELRGFINGAELIIHNAPFDISFLDMEFSRLGLSATDTLCADVQDTYLMAKNLHPGKKNSLDALCDRHSVDNTRRTLHGALLDTELLSEVWLAMTRGQDSLMMDHLAPGMSAQTPFTKAGHPNTRPPLIVLRAQEEECVAHSRILESIGKETRGACLWLSQTAGISQREH